TTGPVYFLPLSPEGRGADSFLPLSPPGRGAGVRGGQPLYAIASTVGGGNGNYRLIVRRWEPGQKEVVRMEFDLPSPLAGTPGLAAGALVLPLANGTVIRQPLQPKARAEGGPTWRAQRADQQSRGHVVQLNAADFL